jgi:hypothetical protein
MSGNILAPLDGVFMRHLTTERGRGGVSLYRGLFRITSLWLRTLSGVYSKVSAEFGTVGRPRLGTS